MPLRIFPPLPPHCAIDSRMKQPCSPEVAEAPWQGIVARVPQSIFADHAGDLAELRVPCFVTIARMMQGPDEAPLLLQFKDVRTGQIGEVPIATPGDFFRPPPPYDEEALPPSPLVHFVTWRSMDLTDSHDFHVGYNRFRFKVANLVSAELQVMIEVAHLPQAQ